MKTKTKNINLFLLISLIFSIVLCVVLTFVFTESREIMISAGISCFTILVGVVYYILADVNQKKLYENLSTKATLSFPNNILEINKLIKKYSENTSKYCLDIFTDVPGYAIFSNNILYNQYKDTIHDSAIPVFMYHYGGELLNRQRDMQFADLDQKSEQELTNSVKKVMVAIQHSCINRCQFPDCRKECSDNHACYVLQKYLTNDKASIRDVARKLQDIALQDMKDLQTRHKANFKITLLHQPLPFFAWVILDRHTKKPIEGIFSFNVYSETMVEKSFKTEDIQLLNVLYETLVCSTRINVSNLLTTN
jgi:hypothetical protein